MRKPIIITLHVGYWIMYLLLIGLMLVFAQQNHGGHAMPAPHLIHIMVAHALIPAVIGFYAAYSFLFPVFLQKKKLGLLTLGLLMVLFTAAAGTAMYMSFMTHVGLFGDGWTSFFQIIFLFSFIALINAIIAMVLRGAIAWFDEVQHKKELQQKHFEMEMALIKAQIDPHFLFNTLNNIDVLIAKDAAQASAYLNKLSDIMRFMLYETKTDRIPLNKEMEYIEKYLDLQRIRIANPNFLQYEVKGEAGNWTIAPMLFLPFLENAFKFATDKKMDNAIQISLHIETKQLIFKCANQYAPHASANKEGGLGMELIQRRLQLLYPRQHQLVTSSRDGIFNVELTLLRE